MTGTRKLIKKEEWMKLSAEKSNKSLQYSTGALGRGLGNDLFSNRTVTRDALKTSRL